VAQRIAQSGATSRQSTNNNAASFAAINLQALPMDFGTLKVRYAARGLQSNELRAT